jgi:hypothetical protein
MKVGLGQKCQTPPEKLTQAKKCCGCESSGRASICLASARPWVQTSLQKKKKQQKKNLSHRAQEKLEAQKGKNNVHSSHTKLSTAVIFYLNACILQEYNTERAGCY